MMRRRNQGFSLVAAIFLIVVLATLGLFAVKVVNGQQQSVDLALLESRAMSAANAGIEWGAYRAQNGGNCTDSNFSLNEGSLTGFDVAVTCLKVGPMTEQGSTFYIYDLTSTASYGTYGQPSYV